jgi:ABC-type multidrug transport system ATPase subunit
MRENKITPDLNRTVELKNICKSFARLNVLRDLSLSVYPGEIALIRGDNGSGKSTLLSILSSQTSIDSGTIYLDGLHREQNSKHWKSFVGFVPHNPILYGGLTVHENLMFYAKLYSVVDPETIAQKICNILEVSNLWNVRVQNLSHGLKKRVGLVRALLHTPKLLLLDEPESGLDSNTLKKLEIVVRRFCAQGGTVILTTHSNVIDYGDIATSYQLKKGELHRLHD